MNPLDKLGEKLNERYAVEAENTTVRFLVSKEDVESFFSTIVTPSLEKIKEKLKEYKIKSSVGSYVRSAKITVNERVFKFIFHVEKSYDQYSPKIELYYRLEVQKKITIRAFIKSCQSDRITIPDYKTINQEMIIEWFTEMFSNKEEFFVKSDKEEREFYKDMSDFQKGEICLTESDYQEIIREIRELEEYEKRLAEFNQN